MEKIFFLNLWEFWDASARLTGHFCFSSAWRNTTMTWRRLSTDYWRRGCHQPSRNWTVPCPGISFRILYFGNLNLRLISVTYSYLIPICFIKNHFIAKNVLPCRQQSPIREEDLLSERANVFDNDEFDVYHRKDVDLSRIHKGKK